MSKPFYKLSDSDSDLDKHLEDNFPCNYAKSSCSYRKPISLSPSMSPSPDRFLDDVDNYLFESSQNSIASNSKRGRSPSLDQFLDDDDDYCLMDLSESPTAGKKSKKTSPTKKRAPKKTDEAKQKILEAKLKQKEEKQKMLEAKRQQKAEMKKKSEKLQQLKPGECLKLKYALKQFLSTFIDTNLLTQRFGVELLNSLQKSDVKYTVREQEIPNTISWNRDLNNHDVEIEDHILVIWPYDELIKLICTNTLNDSIHNVIKKYSNYVCTVIIYGLEEYFRKCKRNKDREYRANLTDEQPTQRRKPNTHHDNIPNVSRADVEIALGGLQLMLNVKLKFVESDEEIGTYVVQISKAVAETPFKLQRNRTMENVEWFASADGKESVRVDSNGNGLSQLWQQQLCQSHLVGLDVAQAIASVYHSPRELMEAYDKCSNQKEKEILLQDIQIRRGQGPLNSIRRVGPEISRKMCIFFNATDGDLFL